MARDPFDDPEELEPSRPRLNPLVLGLTVVVAVLLGTTLYLFLELKDVKSEIAERLTAVDRHEEQLAQLEGTLNRTSRTVDTQVEEVKELVSDAEKQLSARAREVETKVIGRTQTLAKELEQTKVQQQSAITEVGGKLNQLEQVASETDNKVGSLAGRVDTVKTEVDRNREELEKTIRDLTSVRGDLGVQSGLIATNAKELNALRELGERNYFEFDIQRSNEPQRVGPISIRLRKTDVKRNKFNIDLWADDKRIEKKDKTLLEPVQFYVQGTRLPYELVVNQIVKNRIVGYLSSPKVQQERRVTAATGTSE
jgi:DNA repair exonuclease SbcCD ATPase subunit